MITSSEPPACYSTPHSSTCAHCVRSRCWRIRADSEWLTCCSPRQPTGPGSLRLCY